MNMERLAANLSSGLSRAKLKQKVTGWWPEIPGTVWFQLSYCQLNRLQYVSVIFTAITVFTA